MSMVFKNLIKVLRLNCSTLIVKSFCSAPPHPKLKADIGFKELQSKLASREVTLIDVRSLKELETEGAVPGAINIPLPQLGHAILLPPEDFAVRMGVTKPSASSPIITMCLAGIRARTGQLALHGAGYNNVRRYKGSFEDWVKEGGKVIKADEEDLV